MNEIIKQSVINNGVTLVQDLNMFSLMLGPVFCMFVGLVVAILITYRKPRLYKENKEYMIKKDRVFIAKNTYSKALVALFVMLLVQLYTGSMLLGAFSGCFILSVSRVMPNQLLNNAFIDGFKLMAFCSMVMMSAAGFAEVLRSTGGLDELISSMVSVVNESKAIGALLILLTGLIITLGIGSSFSTVPIMAPLIIPFAVELQFSVSAIVVLLAVAGGLGDSSSPLSESTIGPTSGLNIDGQHDHIFDTVVPAFLHFNIPLFIGGWVFAMVL